jgi:hypothetical protein
MMRADNRTAETRKMLCAKSSTASSLRMNWNSIECWLVANQLGDQWPEMDSAT